MSNGKNQQFKEAFGILLRANGFTVPEFAKKISESERTVRTWESGDSIPRAGKLKKIADFFHISPEKLLNYDASIEFRSKPAPPETDMREIPVISWARGGSADELEQNYGDLEGQIDETFLTNVKDPEAVALILEGDSMAPEYQPGDRVVISRQAEPRPNDVVVARLKESGSVFLKRIKFTGKNSEEVILESVNPAHEPMKFHRSEFRFIYPIVDMRRNPRR